MKKINIINCNYSNSNNIEIGGGMYNEEHIRSGDFKGN